MAQLKLLAPPADSAKLYERWYEFAVYLSHATGNRFSVHIAQDIADFHQRMYLADIVYAPAQEAVRLEQFALFEPIGRPSDQSQEVLYISREGSGITDISHFNNQDVLSASCQVVTRLGQTLLHLKDIYPNKVVLRDSWMQVIRGLNQGICDVGFVNKRFFDELKPISKFGINSLAVSRVGQLHDQLVLNPAWHAELEHFCEIVQTMHRDEKGKEVLLRLGIEQWFDVPRDEATHQAQLLRLSH